METLSTQAKNGILTVVLNLFFQCGTYSELLANSGAFAEFLQTYASENHSPNSLGNYLGIA